MIRIIELDPSNSPIVFFPESGFDPSADTYLGDFWDFGGEPHRNNGPQNFFFFLLANGGAGTNDNEQAYSVQGIGIVDAAKIAYKSLDLYVQSSSTYADARAAAINAATLWFGACSNQVAQTMNAWHAVGVGNPASTCPISGNITGPTVATYYQYCSWTMNPTGGNGVYTYQWQTSENYGSTWSGVVSTSKTYSAYAFNAASTNTHLKLRCTVSSGTQTQIFNHAVDCTDCSFGFSAFQMGTDDKELTSSIGKTGNQTTLERKIDDGETPKLAIFPNPTSDQVSIALFVPRKEENLILIVDASGNIV